MDIEEKRRIRKENAYERYLNRKRAKYMKTMDYGISQVKAAARQDTWSSTHMNCFRFHMPPAETEEHIRKKFERFLHWRLSGANVFTEMRWKHKGRSDLVVCLTNGEVFIEEVICTEKEEDALKKSDYYPFPIKIIKIDEVKDNGI